MGTKWNLLGIMKLITDFDSSDPCSHRDGYQKADFFLLPAASPLVTSYKGPVVTINILGHQFPVSHSPEHLDQFLKVIIIMNK